MGKVTRVELVKGAKWREREYKTLRDVQFENHCEYSDKLAEVELFCRDYLVSFEHIKMRGLLGSFLGSVIVRGATSGTFVYLCKKHGVHIGRNADYFSSTSPYSRNSHYARNLQGVGICRKS